MSPCLVDAVGADIPGLVNRCGVGRESGRIMPRRRARETQVGRGRDSVAVRSAVGCGGWRHLSRDG
jgi:hypothetical protein